MTRQICSYCNQSVFSETGKCLGCGASVPLEITDKPIRDYIRGDPFTYNGVVIWPIYSPGWDECKYHFYTGNVLQAIVPISRRLMDDMFPERDKGYDIPIIPFLWELFLVAVGEKRQYILELASRNSLVKEGQIRFTVLTRYEEPDEYLFGLSLKELREIRDGVLAR